MAKPIEIRDETVQVSISYKCPICDVLMREDRLLTEKNYRKKFLKAKRKYKYEINQPLLVCDECDFAYLTGLDKEFKL